ncbi:Hint domain-containing protein [Psychromarinibacter halotolerans]|uniref:Hint domain-containing protein n=1 Tax=Psychromarinibacter halotolerans TaxID=1775175 RepID=A0ABV7GXK2_9RHOB|nr:Hint domain-containing protein [Psychromarinibacter halotolerans]MDF0598279.1 Hint domain-containing protein [Psychromarinibacter halotolerans]
MVGTIANVGVVLDLDGFGNYYLFTNNPNVEQNDSFTVDTINPYAYNVTCFAAGTQIAAPGGERAVETLEPGDRVLTPEGEATVTWVGRRTVHKLFTPAEKFAPVRVTAGALGDGIPHTDLVLTADHALILDGMAVNAGALVNGTTIRFDAMADLPEQVTYYHVETDHHEVILANGTPAETYVDNVGRRAFDNFAEYQALCGEERTIDEMPLPRIASARLLPADLRARLGLDAEDIAVGF